MPQNILIFISFFRTQFREFLGLFFNFSKSYTYEPNSIFYNWHFWSLKTRQRITPIKQQLRCVQSDSYSTQTQGDLTNATNSNDFDISSGCIDTYYNSSQSYADVWYKATVPSFGKLTF